MSKRKSNPKVQKTAELQKNNSMELSSSPEPEKKDMPTENGAVPAKTEEMNALEQDSSILLLWNTIKHAFLKVWNACGFPQMLLIRFIGAYMIAAGINTELIRFDKTSPVHPIDSWKDFVGASSFSTIVIWTLLGFAFLSFLYTILSQKYRIFDQIAMLGGTLFFGIVMMWKNNNFYNCLGMMAIAIVFTAYTMRHLQQERIETIPKWLTCTIVFGAAAGICAFVAVTSVCHHRIFGTSTFDFGIFVQMFHSLADNLTAVTTCERDEFLSHFYVHASFIYYLLAPFYAIFPNENTLLIAQAILAMGGVVPFFMILKNHRFDGIPRIAASFLYVFCAGILYPCYYDFHENAFLPTVLMWLLYAVDTRKIPLFYIMAVLTCSIKEDAPLYVMCIALFFFFDEKSFKRLHAMVVLLLSGSYFVFITNWLTKNGDGSMMAATRFGNLTINAEDGFGGIVRNVLTDPAYFFSLFFKEDSLVFFLQVLVPMAFLPFMTKKIHRYLMMIPFIIMNLVVGANYGYACKLGYQYIFGPACLLLYMAILNADDFDKERRNTFIFAAASASIIMLTSTISGNISYYTRYQKQKEHYQQMEACLDSVPEDASVAANTWYLPHMADRKEIYILDGKDLASDPYDETIKTLINPTRYDFFVMSPNDENTPYFLEDLERYGYTLYNELEGSILIYVSPTYHVR